jgi:hypothetical protein
MSLSPPPVQSPVDRTASGALAPSQKQPDSSSTASSSAVHQPHNPHPQTSEQRAKFGLAITPVWLQWFNALYTFLTTTIPATYLTITSAAANIHAAASKTTPVDADEIPLLDSASSFSITRLTWANLKATLVTYLSALTTTWGISTTGLAASATTVNMATTLRNAFINGDDSVNQVNNPSSGTTGTAVTITAAAAATSVIDRWYAQSTGQNITAQQVAGTGQFKYAMKLIAGATGPTTTLFGTRLEGKDCYKYISQPMNIQVGTFGNTARTVTWTAYYANALDNFSAKTQIATGTISATNAAAVYNVQFNAGANAGNGICVEFTTGALTNSTGYQEYYGRQLEQVPSGVITGTAFEFLPYREVLRVCQRYLPCFTGTSGTSILPASGNATSTSAVTVALTTPTTTRVPPTGVAYSAVGSLTAMSNFAIPSAATAIAFSWASCSAVTISVTGTGAPYAINSPAIIFQNAAGATLSFTGCELW